MSKKRAKKRRHARVVTDAPTPVAIVQPENSDGPSVVLIDHGYHGPFDTRKEAMEWAKPRARDWWVFPLAPPELR